MGSVQNPGEVVSYNFPSSFLLLLRSRALVIFTNVIINR